MRADAATNEEVSLLFAEGKTKRKLCDILVFRCGILDNS